MYSVRYSHDVHFIHLGFNKDHLQNKCQIEQRKEHENRKKKEKEKRKKIKKNSKGNIMMY